VLTVRDVGLLIDTYDTEAAARKIVALSRPLAERGVHLRAVRIDGGVCTGP
jgi:nicotinate phosphoribosyltransferase